MTWSSANRSATVAGAQTATGIPATATNTGGVFVFPVTSLTLTTGCGQHCASTVGAIHNRGRQQWRHGRVLGRRMPATSTGPPVAPGRDQRPAHRSSGLQRKQGRSGLPGLWRHHADDWCEGRMSLVSASCRSRRFRRDPMQVPTPPQGAVFVGAGTDMAGYTVSGAGDFNPGVSSLDDFMIGSPGGNGGAGRVNLFYGVSTGTLNSTGQYTAGLIANATNPIALNNPTVPLALTGVGRSVPPSSAPVPAFEPGSRSPTLTPALAPQQRRHHQRALS